MKISLFNTKDLYSDNYGYKIVSDSEYRLTSKNNPPLLRNKYDGIQTTEGAGFRILDTLDTGSVEFLFTPSSLDECTLLKNSSATYSWNAGGVISKNNISKMYINGVNKTSETNISEVFNEDRMHHVVIVFSNKINGDIKFNYDSSGGPSNKYNNISIYSKQLIDGEILNHFYGLVGYSGIQVSESDINITDSGSIYSNADWTVVSTI